MFAMRTRRWFGVVLCGLLGMVTTVSWADSDSATVQVLIIIPERSPTPTYATRLASSTPVVEPADTPPVPGSVTSAWTEDERGLVLRHTYTDLN